MQDLTLERIEQFVERFPNNRIAASWTNMLQDEDWQGIAESWLSHGLERAADYLFCKGKLEMQDIGEYWAFREGLYDVSS